MKWDSLSLSYNQLISFALEDFNMFNVFTIIHWHDNRLVFAIFGFFGSFDY